MLAAIKLSQRMIIIELSEWASEHNKDYIILIAKDYRILAANKKLQSVDLS